MDIYLDNAMLARPSEHAISAMMPYYTDMWGTPAAPHRKGQQVMPSLEGVYRSIYTLLDGDNEDTFIFTSSGAEATNHVIHSTYIDVTEPTGKNQFVAPVIENASIIMPMSRLEKSGCVGKTIEVNSSGYVTAEKLGDVITPRTALVSMSWAHGLTGLVQPIAEISDLCKERGILFHLDATHVLGKLYFELEDTGADIITFNGSQLHAPQGTGGIFLRGDKNLTPMIVGGLEQAGLRAGDMNIPHFVALGAAAKEAHDCRDLMCTEVARLRDKLEQGVLAAVADTVAVFEGRERLPHIAVLAFPGITNEALLYLLSQRGVYACIGGGDYQQIGHVLAASGVEETIAHASVSFCLSRTTTEEEIDQCIEILVETVEKLKKTSKHLGI